MDEVTRIAVSDAVRSLVWQGDDLVDWASGGQQFRLDGTVTPRRFIMSFPFDRAVVSPSGRYVAVVARFGTKAIVLRDGRVHRELNRSYYFAESYEYPLALFALPDGRECVAHCPAEYNRLEIEDLDSGERLTTRGGESPDFFHSRLNVTKDGRYLLSAGWIWHPVDILKVFELPKTVQDPTELDRDGESYDWGEVHSAAVRNDGRAIVSTTPIDEENTGKTRVGVLDLGVGRIISEVTVSSPAGELMPVGEGHAVAFYDHPRLISLSTGECVREWSEIPCGKQNSSINSRDSAPAIACDEERRRFAVAAKDHIAIVSLSPTTANG